MKYLCSSHLFSRSEEDVEQYLGVKVKNQTQRSDSWLSVPSSNPAVLLAYLQAWFPSGPHPQTCHFHGQQGETILFCCHFSGFL